jgi:hypothetical protein
MYTRLLTCTKCRTQSSRSLQELGGAVKHARWFGSIGVYFIFHRACECEIGR